MAQAKKDASEEEKKQGKKEEEVVQGKGEAKALFILGPPGAGKGTQTELITKKYGKELACYSAGDLLRAARNDKNNKYSELINEYIKEGKIVPVKITIGLIKQKMSEDIKNNNIKCFLIDGFPRDKQNKEGWNQEMKGYCDVKGIIWLNIDEKIVEKRILNRNQGRVDDNADALKKRLKTYKEESLPVIKSYDKSFVHEIDASKEINKVFEQFSGIICKLLDIKKK